MAANERSNITQIFKELYTDERMSELYEKIKNQQLFGVNWTDFEMLYGGPEIINELKKTKIFKLAKETKF